MALEHKFTEVAENQFYSMAYHKFIDQGRLMASKCNKCKHLSIPPNPFCHKCHQNDMELVEMKGNGILAAYTVITVAPPLMAEEGFDRNNPYCSGVVKLDEGPKVTARVLGFDLTKPEQIAIGTPVKAEYVQVGQEDESKTFLAFRASVSL